MLGFIPLIVFIGGFLVGAYDKPDSEQYKPEFSQVIDKDNC